MPARHLRRGGPFETTRGREVMVASRSLSLPFVAFANDTPTTHPKIPTFLVTRALVTGSFSSAFELNNFISRRNAVWIFNLYAFDDRRVKDHTCLDRENEVFYLFLLNSGNCENGPNVELPTVLLAPHHILRIGTSVKSAIHTALHILSTSSNIRILLCSIYVMVNSIHSNVTS